MIGHRHSQCSRMVSRTLLALGLCLAAGLVAATNQIPKRARVAVARFEIPQDLAKEVTPQTLTQLLMEVGQGGLRHEPTLPTEHLGKVIERLRNEQTLPAAEALKLTEADFAKTKAKLLLLPAVSQLAEDWIMTATLVDLSTGEHRVLKVTRKGGESGQMEGMIEELWRQIDAPATVFTFEGHTEKVHSVTFSSDGKLLATASETTARLWDVATGREKFPLDVSAKRISAVAFSPDNTLLATASSDKTTLWDATTGKERVRIPPRDHVKHLAFSADGRSLATFSPGKVTIWDVATGKENVTIVGAIRSIHAMAWSPDGKVLASGDAEGTVKLWDVATGKEQTILKRGPLPTTISPELSSKRYSQLVWSAMFSPNGKVLATTSINGAVRLWDIETGSERATLRGHTYTTAIAFSSNGTLLATAAGDKTVRVHEVRTGKERFTLEKQSDAVNLLAFSPDGKLLATGTDVRMVAFAVPKHVAPPPARPGNGPGGTSPPQPALTPARAQPAPTPATAPPAKLPPTIKPTERVARVWDVATGKERFALTPAQGVSALAFSPDGKLLVTGSHDGTVTLWSLVP